MKRGHFNDRARIDLITTARADYGLVHPIAQAIAREPGLCARLIYTGSHFSREQRPNLPRLRATAGVPQTTVPCAGAGDSDFASGLALSQMVAGFTRLWRRDQPALCFILGDRFETLAPASVALLLGVPIGHAFGGECDVGYCFDTQIRNALTKMAHAHFVAHAATRRRLQAMGEESWRVFVTGNPAVGASRADPGAFLALAAEMGWGTGPFIAACYLPPTTLRDRTEGELEALLAALAPYSGHRVVWTGINADPGAQAIKRRLLTHCARHRNHVYVESLGTERYHALLGAADVLVGNSSSGLLEAASYGLPVVNVGVRQTGRLSGNNVVNVPGDRHALHRALHRAIYDEAFRRRVARMRNPFQRSDAAGRMARGLAQIVRVPRQELMVKRLGRGNPARIGRLRRVPEYS